MTRDNYGTGMAAQAPRSEADADRPWPLMYGYRAAKAGQPRQREFGEQWRRGYDIAHRLMRPPAKRRTAQREVLP